MPFVQKLIYYVYIILKSTTYNNLGYLIWVHVLYIGFEKNDNELDPLQPSLQLINPLIVPFFV